MRAALDLRLRALLKHDPGTRTGADIEDLHQMRVSVRRMRAALKAARPLLDAAWADGLRAELGWLGGALGPVRDLDVMLLRLHEEIGALPDVERVAGETLTAALEAERVQARAAMNAALDAPRYTALLERIADAIRLPLPTPSATQAQPELIDLVRAEARKLRRAVERAGENPPDAVLHALRIYGKRVRYTGELVEPSLRGTDTGTAVKRLLTATAALQEVLGDHQDACVRRAWLRGASSALTPEAALVAGQLVAAATAAADQARDAFPEAWKRANAGRLRTWLSR